jgi:cytochrome c553
MRRTHAAHAVPVSPRSVFALAAAAFLLTAAALVPAMRAGASADATKNASVRLRDAGITVAPKTAPVGTVKFTVKNIGKRPHNFVIATKKTATLAPGKSATLLVVFKKAGSFPYRSTVAGDVKAGLKGTFKLTAPKPATPGDATKGKSVFVANCGTCHTLKAAGTNGTIGPNLDSTSLAFATIVNTVTKGKQGSAGAMPPFGGQLTKDEIDNVAAFVYASTH